MENYSLSDLAAVTGNEGFGGNNAFVLILLFAMIFGNGNGFFGNRSGDGVGQYATAASQNEILFGQQFQGLDNKIDRIGNGIADSTFALNNSITSAASSLNNAITSEGRTMQAQLSNCCCENLRNTDAIRYDMAVQNNTLATAIHAEGEQTRALIQADKIEALQAQVNNLTMQNAINTATAGVVKYPMTSAWAMSGNPFCSPCGCNISVTAAKV